MTVFVNQSNLCFLPKENRMPLSKCWEQDAGGLGGLTGNRMLEDSGVSRGTGCWRTRGSHREQDAGGLGGLTGNRMLEDSGISPGTGCGRTRGSHGEQDAGGLGGLTGCSDGRLAVSTSLGRCLFPRWGGALGCVLETLNLSDGVGPPGRGLQAPWPDPRLPAGKPIRMW